jgi:hypothetical protein
MTSFRRSLAVITCLVLIASGAPGLFAESSAAAITGVILDPSGKPASGFQVVFRDVASNTRFTSGPTDASGNYALEVPLGGRYKIEGVVASDGVTKLPVQEIPPISVLTPGTTRLNVRFTNASPPSAAPAETAVAAKAAPTAPAPAPATATAKAEPAEKKKKAAAPWYKRPGPITGMVIGGVAIVALAAGGGGGGGGVASQSTPSQ